MLHNKISLFAILIALIIPWPSLAVQKVDADLIPPSDGNESESSEAELEIPELEIIQPPDAYGDPALLDTATDESTALIQYDTTYTAAGETLELQGYFKNDVIVAGNNITITGIVEGDVIAAGANVIINAPVSGDIRIAGGNISIQQPVKRNASLFGGRIVIESNAVIERDVYTQAGDLTILGAVNGKISGGAGNVVIDGPVGDDVYFKNVGTVRLRSNAQLAGDLLYSSSEQAVIDPLATVKGKTVYSPPLVEPKEQTSKFTAWFWLREITGLVGIWLLGSVILKLFERRSAMVVKYMLVEVGHSLLWGIIYLITVPAILAILLFTLIGIPLSIFGILLFGISLYLAKIYVGTALGKLLLPKSKSLVSPMLLGCGIVYIITNALGALAFPWFFFGTFISIFATFWATGGIVLYARERLQQAKLSSKLPSKKSNGSRK